MAARARGRARREAAPARPALARAHVRGRDRGDDGHRGARRVEREGKARAGLGAALSELAGGLRGGVFGCPARGPADRTREEVKLLLLSGSLRAGSTNQAVLQTAVQVAPPGVE